MNESVAEALSLRVRRLPIVAAVLSSIGLIASLEAPSRLTLGWFAVLIVCLILALARARGARRRGEAVAASAGVAQARSAPLEQGTADAGTNFLSTVGHDLRQPLQAISLYSATLATHALPEASRQLVTGLDMAAETLSAQFEEVMAIAKLEAGRVTLDTKPVALEAIFSNAIAEHLDEAHDKALHLRHVGTPLWVRADEALLARAVDRLVGHAVHSAEEGGVLLGARRRGDSVLIEVRDTSGGISPDLQSEVFTPFSSYGQRMTDRGLGLVYANRIVERLGGSLSMRSVFGRGNVFSIRLPRLTRSNKA